MHVIIVIVAACITGAHETKPCAECTITCALQVELVLPVLGSNGKVAHAQVQSSGQNHMDIQVQLPGGRLLKIDPHESAYEIDQDDDDFSQKGRVIDVDWREVR